MAENTTIVDDIIGSKNESSKESSRETKTDRKDNAKGDTAKKQKRNKVLAYVAIGVFVIIIGYLGYKYYEDNIAGNASTSGETSPDETSGAGDGGGGTTGTPTTTPTTPPIQIEGGGGITAAEWEQLLAALEHQQTSVPATTTGGKKSATSTAKTELSKAVAAVQKGNFTPAQKASITAVLENKGGTTAAAGATSGVQAEASAQAKQALSTAQESLANFDANRLIEAKKAADSLAANGHSAAPIILSVPTAGGARITPLTGGIPEITGLATPVENRGPISKGETTKPQKAAPAPKPAPKTPARTPAGSRRVA
jgi:hypothetical protein